MPAVLRVGAFRFFFYSLENNEPVHIHVENGDNSAKFWLQPVNLARSQGFRSHEITRIRAIVIENRLKFQEAWYEHFGTAT